MDAGCGSGRDSLFFAKQGFIVTGIDISNRGIEKAKAAAKKQKATFVVGSVEKLPFADSRFDAAYSGYVLQHTDIKKSIKELARVLKSGSSAAVVMFEETEYEKPSEYDTMIDHKKLLAVFSDNFSIVEQKIDEYSEEDKYGKHRHKRIKLVLKKR